MSDRKLITRDWDEAVAWLQSSAHYDSSYIYDVEQDTTTYREEL